MPSERIALKRIRVRLELTQAQAGRLVRRSAKWVCDLEKGRGGESPGCQTGINKLLRAYRRRSASKGIDASLIDRYQLFPDLFPAEMNPPIGFHNDIPASSGVPPIGAGSSPARPSTPDIQLPPSTGCDGSSGAQGAETRNAPRPGAPFSLEPIIN